MAEELYKKVRPRRDTYLAARAVKKVKVAEGTKEVIKRALTEDNYCPVDDCWTVYYTVNDCGFTFTDFVDTAREVVRDLNKDRPPECKMSLGRDVDHEESVFVFFDWPELEKRAMANTVTIKKEEEDSKEPTPVLTTNNDV